MLNILDSKLVVLSQLIKPNNSSLKVFQFIINNDSFVPYIAVALIELFKIKNNKKTIWGLL